MFRPRSRTARKCTQLSQNAPRKKWKTSIFHTSKQLRAVNDATLSDVRLFCHYSLLFVIIGHYSLLYVIISHYSSLFVIISHFLAFWKKMGYWPTDWPTDGRSDRQTDTASYRDARTHLKTQETNDNVTSSLGTQLGIAGPLTPIELGPHRVGGLWGAASSYCT